MSIGSLVHSIIIASNEREKLLMNNENRRANLVEREILKPLQVKVIEQTIEVNEIIDEILRLDGLSNEDYTFYWKQKGGLYKKVCQADYKNELLEWKQKASESYQKSSEYSNNLYILNSIRLGLALDYSIFKYDILGEYEQAVEIAQQTFTRAISEINSGVKIEESDSWILNNLNYLLDYWNEEEKGPDTNLH